MSKETKPELIEQMASEAKNGRISRREFLQYALAAGITASSGSLLWSSEVAAASPKRGGTFRWGIHDGNTSDTHDPGTYVTRQMIFLAHQYRSYLTLIESDNSLGPDLATEWEAAPGAKQWTFKLNKNATFHSGRKVTANDVVASINHHRGEKTTSAAKALLSDVEDVVADDDHTVTFKLSSGNADLPWLMTDYHFAICPANADGTIDWKSGDGCGPYKIESGEFGVSWNLSRHNGWHGEGAYFDAVEMTVLNDPNARQTALVTGDVDCVSLVDLKTLSLLKRNPNIEIDNVPSGAAITLPMFCDTAPFNDVNVRNALKLSIDRQEIVDKIAFGAATMGNDFHLAPGQPYFPESIPQREYDPDKAKALLKKAGAEGLTVSLSTADSVFSGAVDMCVLYAEQAKRAGIKINVVREPNDGYYSDVWLKKPFSAVSWGSRPTPDVMFTLAYKHDAAWNESHWQNDRFNELLMQAKAELDQGLRGEMYNEMCQLMRDDGGTVIPFFNNFVSARSKKVMHGPELAASWTCDGARAPSRWWFA
ncbi:MAG: peptide ABC transporter substrate-binding protein [Candidatus Sedimenticola endophacoides]|uniref:Peptide ABC transporter substrate-binding protein n=2 Tax=Candidatus Sedimenticola endophacoides TaxID=2548426 RepID=A0A657PVT6_9GAMM|nr:MAG: peptide ABC transporter substrate-binding protein [Candidatus Sedimenticola endophacoides]OQX34035.1 MAG: peptide ABC transporter substrate-binding protein [Candidatus Sedimenticola endophacoides]OQX42253.1 MAG: peptide ABC transporter substrate-binding protein [Candidatus Sedimenticola endophacoides]OQX44199.1 MAG: peptide ABC transporter substrate-binding protein [Candidatus Sedimenticola endophacoides]OQX45988.1 MAG: peptide ABC transporter substrate-binding protein [Candidatus Sedim